MKKIITFLTAAVLAALPLSAVQTSPEPAAKQETKEFKLSGFHGLDVSWIYQVELTRSARYSVRVEAPDFAMPYLKVKVSDGVLELETEDLPKDIRRRLENNRHQVRAFVSMPELTSLEMSGATKLQASGEFSSRKDFELELSGAAQLQGLSIQAREAEIQASGAAKLDLKGRFDAVEVSLSGAAGAIADIDAKDFELEVGGAAKLSLKGKVGRMESTLSGAANVVHEGSVNQVLLTGSGAVKIDTSSAPADIADIRLSGAAKAIIAVQQTLSVHLSGASSCHYRPGKDLRITEQSVARGSSLVSL